MPTAELTDDEARVLRIYANAKGRMSSYDLDDSRDWDISGNLHRDGFLSIGRVTRAGSLVLQHYEETQK